MKRKNIGYINRLYLIALTAFLALASSAQAGGLIPCGRNISIDPNDPTGPVDPNNPLNAPCTLCHVAILVQNIINFLMGLVGILTVLVLVFAGATYILAVGNPSVVNRAKDAIKWALGGFALTLTAWLIINTILLTMGYSKPLGGGNDWWRLTIECTNPSASTPTSGR